LTPARARPLTFELARARDDSAGLLVRAGVAVGVASGRTHEVRNLRWEAGTLVRLGLSAEQALAAITTVPLLAYGLRAELGARVGLPPTFALWNGDPLGLDGHVAAVAVGDALELAPVQR
jgi:imidazolonepropionase-like amidohydrolase